MKIRARQDLIQIETSFKFAFKALKDCIKLGRANNGDMYDYPFRILEMHVEYLYDTHEIDLRCMLQHAAYFGGEEND